MKKVLTLAVLSMLLFNVASVWADPFIVSDPDPAATKYRVRLSSDNGVTWGAWAEGLPVTNALKFDVGPVAAGNYKAEAQAYGGYTVTDDTTGQVSTVQAWSASAPFRLIVPKGKPTNIHTVGN